MSSGVAVNRTYIDLPADVSAEIMQKTQEESAVMRLARRISLPGRGVTIPVITGDPTAAWVAETAVKPVSNPTVSTKLMTAYKLAVKAVDQAVSKGILHKNTAARKKSSMTLRLNKLA